MAKALSYSLKLKSECSNELPSLLVAVSEGGVISALAQYTPRWKPTAVFNYGCHNSFFSYSLKFIFFLF